ncbi:ROK family transcriptional regulator [Saccharothrix sp. NRRL B-16348]|uniref:ROK family transcriptional regulator n=1 Tax=Saccharothrix sp. NRRL B-16348 TaxID=1415542 RepID=UPI0006AFE750|nr:ROK family transcriptional regulator [Saccharothrix sp. NRRL B-16348]KOX15338.1 ROK family transcriptional regulator [Saccharothrix sp. NRRL B-16348]
MKSRPTRPRTGGSTADQVTVRRHNLSVVLSHLRDHGPRSRARLAEETGLNKATVSSLVAELVDRGLVGEGETERATVGRPGQIIRLDGEHVVAVGAEVNVGYLSVLVLNLRGQVVARQRVALDTAALEPALVLARLGRLLDSALVGVAARPVGVAIAVPGLVEVDTGVVRAAPNLGWTDVPVVAEITRLLGEPPYPVLLDNEANLAALAEVEAQGLDRGGDLVLITGTAGVGGGIVVGGRLLRGADGFAGEVGHMRVRADGPPCGCGRTGCWEAAVGLNALLAAAPEDGPPQDLERRLAEIGDRAAAGDARVLAAIADVDRWLTVGAGILVNVFNPHLLVLGGYFAALRPWLAGSLRDELRGHAFARDIGGTRVVFSSLGFTGPVRGGASQILDRVFRDPVLVEPVDKPLAQEEIV